MRAIGFVVLAAACGALLLAQATATDLSQLPPLQGTDPGLHFPNIGYPGNARATDYVQMDVDQHPILMTVVFGGLRPNQTLIEVLPSNGYWADFLGSRLTTGNAKGHFVQVVDQADKAVWDARIAEKIFRNEQYGDHIEVMPLNLDSLAAPGSADMVLLSKKMAALMRAGNLDRVLAAANKGLKPGGVLLVEDYRAAADKPQDPKAASGYIREDYAIAQIEKAGFKLADKEEKLLANANDTRAKTAANSDRFLLKFTK